MSNSSGTDCTYTGNCTVLDGGTTNGTVFLDPGFDPVGGDRWHQRMELITICVVNSLSRKLSSFSIISQSALCMIRRQLDLLI